MRKLLALRLLVAGAVLSAGLVGAAILHIMAVTEGTELVFQAEAFDPRALLTGHYAQLRYAISRAEFEATGLNSAPGWQRVWVAIAPAENDWTVVSVSAQKPASAPAGGHLVVAETKYRGPPVILRYGIERIYAQQDEAQAIDQTLRSVGGEEAGFKVVAALGRDGRLRVKGLIAGGKRTDFGWW